jgi:hypothetical protein
VQPSALFAGWLANTWSEAVMWKIIERILLTPAVVIVAFACGGMMVGAVIWVFWLDGDKPWET